MFIEEMIFSGKHYYRQNELLACFELCRSLRIASLSTHYNTQSGFSSAWWSYQKISICFKAEFNTCQEMINMCNNLVSAEEIPTYDKCKQPVIDLLSQNVYKEIIKILANAPCRV